ncbi:TonB-dependent receptor domain-containing protein [Telmatospirillum sp.]|uniref:TonB-dependent receptor plug domain-containing protein n=1 Tax=Telmatospirillum sp. TaxID=2079197 RepID=UPI00284D4059|nr:TonB-dependent receptor [Telmatospirillum sp.]MDR3438633.1 TonB-dependent receptor [Telmatospirillum sp.]
MRRIVSLAALGLTVLVTRNVQAQEFDYRAAESLFGEPVTMSATGKPERVSDTAVLMKVITAEDIRRSGARNIPTLLQRLGGIDVVHESPDSVDVGFDGFNQVLNGRVMVLINGRQVYFDAYGAVFWSTLPVELEEIRQIEIIHGAQSALYGFNAVDGVINIVTFDPINDKINMVRARVGNHARRDIAATTTQPLGDQAGIRLTAADDHAQDYGIVWKTPADRAFFKNPNRRSISLDAAASASDDRQASLEASHTDVSERLIASGVLFNARIKSDVVKVAYAEETNIGRLSATASYSNIDMPWEQNQAAGVFHIGDTTAVAQISDLFKLGPADSFRVGLDGRHDQVSAPGTTGGFLTSDMAAPSLMWEHRFSPNLSAVNAVRYDYLKLGRSGDQLIQDIFSSADFDRSDQAISVNSSILQSLTEEDKLRLSFARGLALPSLAYLGKLERMAPVYGGYYSYGNPDLRASPVYSYRVGWDHQFRSLDATSRVVLFHDMTMNQVVAPFKVINSRLVQEFINSTGSVTNGLELGLEHKARQGWNWGGNYTYQRVHEHYNWGLRNAAPVNKLNGNIGYGWGEWEADLYASYISATKGLLAMPGNPPKTVVANIKGHTALSPRIAWQPTASLSVELTAENLWSYRDVLSQRMEPSYFLTLRVAY